MNNKPSFGKQKIGLVLSGGAARGFAHIGVLKAMDELGIRPDIISGVSVGAMVGALYSNGLNPDKILEIFKDKKFLELAEFRLRRNGMLSTNKLRKIFKTNLTVENIAQLDIPLVIGATNLNSGKIEFFREGNLIDILLASSGLPVLFETTKLNGIPYMDGGIMDNLPVDSIRKECDILIAVHVNPTGELQEVKGILNVAFRTFHLAIASTIHLKRPKVDVFIEPEPLKHYGVLELGKAIEMFDIGYQCAMKILKEKSALIHA